MAFPAQTYSVYGIHESTPHLSEPMWYTDTNVTSNADLDIDLLEIVFEYSLMEFRRKYFQQTFCMYMRTIVAPILANLFIQIEMLP